MPQKSMQMIAIFGILFLILAVPSVFANKSAVSIEAPAKASVGSTITIKLNVTHKGNSRLHHTNWVSLNINGDEVKRWEYVRKERPEAGNFTVTYTLKVDAAIEIVAQSNCTLHGSAGLVSFKVDVE